MSLIAIYASSRGNTKAVAEYIASKTGGKAVDVANAASEDLSSYDTIVIGGRVWAGSVPKELVEYVKNNKEVISQKKSAFYVCCMYNDEKGQKQCDKLFHLVFSSSRLYCESEALNTHVTPVGVILAKTPTCFFIILV